MWFSGYVAYSLAGGHQKWGRRNILPPLLEKQLHASPIRLHDVVTQDENLRCCNYIEYYADERDYSNNNEKISEALFKALLMVHVCFHYYQHPFQFQVYWDLLWVLHN